MFFYARLLLRQRRGWLIAYAATANGVCARMLMPTRFGATAFVREREPENAGHAGRLARGVGMHKARQAGHQPRDSQLRRP